jgi:hypothetical protein
MRTHLLTIIIAVIVASTAANARDVSTKPHLLGTWDNTLGCGDYPASVTIKSATNTGAKIESTDSAGQTKSWSDDETRVVGPPTGPDLISFKSARFEYVEGSLDFQQNGGFAHCLFTKASPH